MDSNIDERLDAFRELVNIGMGRSADLLNQMLGTHISLTVPVVYVSSREDISGTMEDVLKQKLSIVQLEFRSSFSGLASLVFPPSSASALVSLLTGEEAGSAGMDAVKAGTLSEVGNIVLNGVLGSFSNLLDHDFDFSLPTYLEDSVSHQLEAVSKDLYKTILLIKTKFNVEQYQIEGNILLVFEVGSYESLINAIEKKLM